jgi:hypothetical protein
MEAAPADRQQLAALAGRIQQANTAIDVNTAMSLQQQQQQQCRQRVIDEQRL